MDDDDEDANGQHVEPDEEKMDCLPDVNREQQYYRGIYAQGTMSSLNLNTRQL